MGDKQAKVDFKKKRIKGASRFFCFYYFLGVFTVLFFWSIFKQDYPSEGPGNLLNLYFLRAIVTNYIHG